MSALPSSALTPLPAALPDSAGWQQAAACRFEDRDLFFPPEEERGRYAGFREAAAQRICRSCPVREECLGYALAADERYGVWGGMTAEQRARRRRGKRGGGPDGKAARVPRTGNLARAALPPVSRRAAQDASRRP